MMNLCNTQVHKITWNGCAGTKMPEFGIFFGAKLRSRSQNWGEYEAKSETK